MNVETKSDGQTYTKGTQRDRDTKRQTNWQTDRQIDRQADGQIIGQTCVSPRSARKISSQSKSCSAAQLTMPESFMSSSTDTLTHSLLAALSFCYVVVFP